MKTEKIMCSAIWVKDKSLKMTHAPTNINYGVVFCGYRHCDCFELMSLVYTREQSLGHGVEHGFLTTNKRFTNRVEAKNIAVKENQLLKNSSNKKELFSEDVWLINFEEDEYEM